MATRIYLDSCIVIYLIEGAETIKRSVDKAIRDSLDSEFCVTDLVRMECRTGPLRRHDYALLAAFDDFFSLTTILSLHREVFDLATELRASSSHRTADAVHLAAAIFHQCDEFWTNDTRLSSAKAEIPVRILHE